MSDAPHIPVLIDDITRLCGPFEGTWVDGTMGAGGYTRALLDSGVTRLVAIDRDPLAHEMAQSWAAPYGDRLQRIEDTFSNMAHHVSDVQGVVLDLGVSSMQLDLAERGFSFMQDGPLDMRMSQSGRSAADLVNELPETELANLLYFYGEERASRRIARSIVTARTAHPITRTAQLTELIEGALPRPKPGQSHPATRSFQALRIAVNTEYDELMDALHAAEAILAKDGLLVVVTFHSIEDRMVKRFIAQRSAGGKTVNRYAPLGPEQSASFENLTRKAVKASDTEIARNPRARSAVLRIARRTAAPAEAPLGAGDLGMPVLPTVHKSKASQNRRGG